jgi:hypothetical protein
MANWLFRYMLHIIVLSDVKHKWPRCSRRNKVTLWICVCQSHAPVIRIVVKFHGTHTHNIWRCNTHGMTERSSWWNDVCDSYQHGDYHAQAQAYIPSSADALLTINVNSRQTGIYGLPPWEIFVITWSAYGWAHENKTNVSEGTTKLI